MIVSAIDIVVYFAKNVGLQLKVCDGQNLTASELFEDVMEEQSYPNEARQLFSLWLVSDLLGTSLTFLLIRGIGSTGTGTGTVSGRNNVASLWSWNIFCSGARPCEAFSLDI